MTEALPDGELFAGPGGWDVAARLLGVHPKGLEWDDAACATAQAAGHFRFLQDGPDGKPVGLDVAVTDPASLFPYVEQLNAWIRLLIGSPPCQAFSAAGKGKGRNGAAFILMGVQLIAWGNDPVQVCKWVDEQLDDPRAALVLEPLRWAKNLHPEYIALEQVPPVLPLWEAMAEVLRIWGYSVWCGNLQAEQYDVPQTRKRAILIASRVREVSAPPPVRRKFRKGIAQNEAHKLDDPGLKPWISMSQALGWGGTARPGYTVLTGGTETGGTETGGAEPFGNGARQQMAKAQERGEWDLKLNSQPNAAVRASTEPASTVFFAERSNNASWVQRSNYNGPPTPDGSPRTRSRRALGEPSVALTSKPGHWEPQWLRSNHGQHDRPRDPDTGKLIVRQGNQDWYYRTGTDNPAPTISSGIDGAAWDNATQNVDGSYQRAPEKVTAESVRVTVREAAILQGFPPDYPWQGTKSAQYRQVGDAMPPPLAWHVLRALFGLPVQHYPGTEYL